MTTPTARHRPIRQSDVARHAGVSQSAVSRVISGDAARIPEETRQRIHEAIAELGYVPNPVARNLRGARTQLLGVHTFEPLFPHAREGFYVEFLLGIEQRAEETGHDLVLFSSTGDGAGGRRIYRDETNRLRIADGSVLLGVSPDRDELARLWNEGYPFVHIGRRDVPGASIPCIIPDYRAAASEIVGRLYELGHRRLAYLRDSIDVEPYEDRRAGYAEAVVDRGMVDESPGYREGRAGVPDEVVTALAEGRCTAAVVESERVARELRSRLNERRIDIPGDVSVAVLEDTSATDIPWDDLRIPRQEIGRIAVDRLIEMVDDPDAARGSTFVACTVVSGGTVATARTERR